MLFDKVLEKGDCTNKKVTRHREAVRAVILKDNMLLMIYTNKGDYKFPGGGIEKGESHRDALARELLEETGYHLESVKECIGRMIERNPDTKDQSMLFEMVSHYYLCDISGTQVAQKLDQYEADLEFETTWISVEDAILKNKNVLDLQKEHINPWVDRELFVLKKLKKKEI